MFMKTDIPHIYPGATLLGYVDGPVVDTGCEMPAGGRVYIHWVEFRELCHHFDAVDAQVHANTTERLTAAIERANSAEQRLADLQHLIADAPSMVRDFFETAAEAAAV